MTWHNTILLPKKKSRRSGDFLHLFNLVFRAAILDLPVDLPCHSIYTDLVEQPDLQDLVMSMLPEEVMGLQVIRWWPVHHQRRRHHLRLTWVNYAAPAKKAPIAAVFNHLFLFCCPLQVSDHHCIHYLTRNIHIQCWGLLINWLLGMMIIILFQTCLHFLSFLRQTD